MEATRATKVNANSSDQKTGDAEKSHKDWEDIVRVLHPRAYRSYQEVFPTNLINHYHDKFLSGHVYFDKIQELITQKYYLPSRQKDIKIYLKLWLLTN